MKKVTQSICFALLALLLCNCTAKFEEFNSNPYEPTELNPRLSILAINHMYVIH